MTDKPLASKRAYRPLNETCGVREPARDLMNFLDVDRACERWLRKHDPSYKSVPLDHIQFDHDD